tara:strand:- start:5737 stop:6342 length:606 start_codon:yes stop_codon:yes gene_type:complete
MECHDGMQMSHENVVSFNSSAKYPYYKFSNFYETKIVYKGMTYPSSEHAFQSQLVDDDLKKHFTIDGTIGSLTKEAFEFVGVKSDKSHQKVDYWKKKRMIGILAKQAVKMFKKKNISAEECKNIFIDILVEKYKCSDLNQLLLGTESKYLLEFDKSASRLKSKGKKCRWGGMIIDEKIVGSNQQGILHMHVRDFYKLKKYT